MWEANPVLQSCIDVWHDAIESAYKSGALTSYGQMLSLGFVQLTQRLHPLYEIKVSPGWQFVKEPGAVADHFESYSSRNWLKKQPPFSYLISNDAEVVAAVEWQFSPGTYVDFRKSVQKLSHLAQLAGRSALHLSLDPYTGKLDQTEGLPISADLLCVYGVITREGAFSLDLGKLRRSLAPELFPQRFLHLAGSVREDRIRFGHVISAPS